MNPHNFTNKLLAPELRRKLSTITADYVGNLTGGYSHARKTE